MDFGKVNGLKALGKSFGIALPEIREEMTSLMNKLL